MNIIKLFWKKWQTLGKFIGGMIAFVLLFVLYCVVLAPFGIWMSLIAQKHRAHKKDSYWVVHDVDLDKLYEQQF